MAVAPTIESQLTCTDTQLRRASIRDVESGSLGLADIGKSPLDRSSAAGRRLADRYAASLRSGYSWREQRDSQKITTGGRCRRAYHRRNGDSQAQSFEELAHGCHPGHEV